MSSSRNPTNIRISNHRNLAKDTGLFFFTFPLSHSSVKIVWHVKLYHVKVICIVSWDLDHTKSCGHQILQQCYMVSMKMDTFNVVQG